ncbi:Two-component system response regulator [Kibdelosporangium sp. 4NS15]|uniref:Two-component system response regulator n=1 Tax=Kibdelosporangium persicum TaxID=2698649 RepID=A0ABX2F5N2_9PSEU|nr:GAF and ANTAR domain-containing protein [Kibdelosporangium persicum]NRN66498.1 Two-component system response regulator [Kibdelosporangium persicum]
MADLLDEVTDAMSALTAALENRSDTSQMLDAVCAEAVRVVPGADMASVTVVENQGARTAAFTDRRAVEIDKVQYEAADGPCLRAAATGEIVRVSLRTARALWPDFVATAQRMGVGSHLAAPLSVDEQLSGAINLFGFGDHGFEEIDSQLLALYTTIVTFGLRTTRRYRETCELAGHLEVAMRSRAVIEQAKGILMASHGIGEEEAIRRLVAESQDTNTKLRQIAADLVRRASASHSP